MKNIQKYSTLFIILLGVFFFGTHNAKADFFYNGNDVNGAFSFVTGTNTIKFTENTLASTTLTSTQTYFTFIATTSAQSELGLMSSVSSIAMIYQTNGTLLYPTLDYDFYCDDGTGYHASGSSTPIQDDSAIHAVTMAFPTTTCDSTTLNYLIFNVRTYDGGEMDKMQISGTDNSTSTGFALQTNAVAGNLGGNYYSNLMPIVSFDKDIGLVPGAGGIGNPAIGNCQPTSFTLVGVDFGEGLCDTVSYLFVPNQTALNTWTDTQTLMASKAPFSYFYDLTNDLTELPTTSSASITPLDLTIGATGTPINFTYDAFSANTIDKYTDSTSRSLLRTVIQYSLYLAFIAMIILEVRKLFSKPKQ